VLLILALIGGPSVIPAAYANRTDNQSNELFAQLPDAAGGAVRAACTQAYLSDLTWTSMTNGWGPAQKDRSNGQMSGEDGGPLTLNGTVYSKGLGTSAASDIRYALKGAYTRFTASVGIDDEVGAEGLVVFQVWADGAKLYDSGQMTGSTATKPVSVDVTGKQELKLIVTDGGNGLEYDHADWADAKLACSGGTAAATPTATSSATAIPSPTASSATATPVAASTPTSSADSAQIPAACLDGTIDDLRTSGFRLPVSRKLDLQTELDARGVLVLDPNGDYATGGLSEVHIRSGQKVFGFHTTLVPRIVVDPGTTGAVLSAINPEQRGLNFPASASSTHDNCFIRMGAREYVYVTGTGATLEDNLFLGMGAWYDFDTRNGGYLKNNRFIRTTTGQNARPAIQLRGDSARRSGGNVFLWTNFLTPLGDSLYAENLADLTFVGIDAEAWNMADLSSKALLTTGPLGAFRVLSAWVGDNFPDPRTGVVDSAADDVYVTGSDGFNASSAYPNITLIERPTNRRSALLALGDDWPSMSTDQASGATRLVADVPLSNQDVTLNGASVMGQSLGSSQQAQVQSLLINPSLPGVPWERPTFGAVSDPAGPGWNSNLASQPDSRATIQAMIDRDGVARLDAGVYYISNSLILKPNQGIIGAGEGRTAIIAKSPNVDVVSIEIALPAPTNGEATVSDPIVLADLTLQGGRNGILHGEAAQYYRVNGAFLSHVTIRDMAGAGIRLEKSWGWDNNFIDHLTFAHNAVGFSQQGAVGGAECYMDKTVFFHAYFVDNGKAIDSHAGRQNTSNAFINSRFERNGGTGGMTGSAIELWHNGNTLFANTDFLDNAGDPVLFTDWPTRVVNAQFRLDRGHSALGDRIVAEGSRFEAGSSSGGTVFAAGVRGYLLNSWTDLALGSIASGFAINSVARDVTAQFVAVRDSTRATILGGTSNPQPQYLRGSQFR
jgi:hypothetical protein